MTKSPAAKHSTLAACTLALFALGASPRPARAQAMPDWWPGTPERVAIRAQIEALSIEYYHRIDHGDAEHAADLFTPDAIFQPGGTERMVGRAAIRAYYVRRSKTIRTRHITTNLRLTYVDADHVEAVRAFTYYVGETAGNPGPYPAEPSVGEYRESLVRGADGMWRYALRVATPVFIRR